MLSGRNHLHHEAVLPQRVRGRSHARFGPDGKVLKVAIKKQQDSTVWSLSRDGPVRIVALQLHRVPDLTDTRRKTYGSVAKEQESMFLSLLHRLGLFGPSEAPPLEAGPIKCLYWMVPEKQTRVLDPYSEFFSRPAACARDRRAPPPTGKQMSHQQGQRLCNARGVGIISGGVGADIYLSVGGGRRVLEGRHIHKDGTVLAVEVIQERREGLVQPTVPSDVTVAGGFGGHPQRHPTLGGVADRALLTAHAVAAAAQTRRADNQRQLQDQLLAARNVNVNLPGSRGHSSPSGRS